MKRYFDAHIEFFIYTAPYDDEYAMSFSFDWSFNEMLDFMCDTYSINKDKITEVRHTYVRQYKLTKDD